MNSPYRTINKPEIKIQSNLTRILCKNNMHRWSISVDEFCLEERIKKKTRIKIIDFEKFCNIFCSSCDGTLLSVSQPTLDDRIEALSLVWKRYNTYQKLYPEFFQR